MPQNTPLSVSNTWQLLTDDNVTHITFQVIGAHPIYILGTNGTTQPSAAAVGVIYSHAQGERRAALADLFPGVPSANRVWARTVANAGSIVFVSHA